MTCYFSAWSSPHWTHRTCSIWGGWQQPPLPAGPSACSPCLLLAAPGEAVKTNHWKTIPGDTFLIFWVTSLETDLWACTPPVPTMDGNRNCAWEYGMLRVVVGAGKQRFQQGTCKERRLLALISLCLRPHLQIITFLLLLSFAIRSPQVPLSCCILNPEALWLFLLGGCEAGELQHWPGKLPLSTEPPPPAPHSKLGPTASGHPVNTSSPQTNQPRYSLLFLALRRWAGPDCNEAFYFHGRFKASTTVNQRHTERLSAPHPGCRRASQPGSAISHMSWWLQESGDRVIKGCIAMGSRRCCTPRRTTWTVFST